MYCGFKYPRIVFALYSWIVKIPPHGNDFLSVAKLTYREREREKNDGKRGEKEDKSREISQRKCMCMYIGKRV